MSIGMILMIIVTTSLAAVAQWVRDLLRPAGTLGLTIFRPYRGDAWPQGVQEDYDVHFDWSPRKPTPPPMQPTWSDIVVAPDDSMGPFTDTADDIEIEELYGETAAAEHVQGEVHTTLH